jgi:hypothetical protein
MQVQFTTLRFVVIKGEIFSYRRRIVNGFSLSLRKVPNDMTYGRIKRKQPGIYRRFVESGIQDIDAAFIESKRQSRLCIGSASFHAQVDEMYQERVDGCNSKEDVSFRREAITDSCVE